MMRRASARKFLSAAIAGRIHSLAGAVCAASPATRQRGLYGSVPHACPRGFEDGDSRSEAPSSGAGRPGSGRHSACATGKRCAERCGPCCKFRQWRYPHRLRTEGAESRCRYVASVASALCFHVSGEAEILIVGPFPQVPVDGVGCGFRSRANPLRFHDPKGFPPAWYGRTVATGMHQQQRGLTWHSAISGALFGSAVTS